MNEFIGFLIENIKPINKKLDQIINTDSTFWRFVGLFE